ncbi:MAG: efflux RND transporter periplasmic adaptor subunit [Bacteroidales bacterium]|jgi:cobalt-zinc-cadmium efflux system membrane fusion protein|nr:efflux RND transporter periplasmic adaptor subunit [Bacteroidales bacterium]
MLAAVSCQNNKTVEMMSVVPLSTGMQTTAAYAEEISRTLQLNGRVVPDEARQASVYALVSGRIGQVNVELGDYVHKGQTLAILKSAEIAGVNNELSLAKQNLEVARKNRETYKELYESNLVSEREFIVARAEYEKALSELQKAENVSAITGGENSTYTLISPISGYIIAKNITSNSEVRADMAEPLFSIADLSEVWVLADVFEVDIENIAVGQTVEVQTLSRTKKTYTGKIDKVYNVLDPETRTMKARVSLANPRNELKAGMFVSVKITCCDVLQSTPTTAIVVPSEALIFDDNQTFVIVLNHNKQPEIRLVKEIFRTGNKCYVEGIADGEIVVTSEQIFLFEALQSAF